MLYMFTNKFGIPINNTFQPNTWESLLWKSNKMHVFDFLSKDILIVGFKNIKRQLRVLVEIETKQNSFILRKRRENVFLVCDSSNTEQVSVCLEWVYHWTDQEHFSNVVLLQQSAFSEITIWKAWYKVI